MSWCELKLKQLKEKGEENWDEDDLETYYYCKGNLEIDAAEEEYLDSFIVIQ